MLLNVVYKCLISGVDSILGHSDLRGEAPTDYKLVL